MSFRRSVFRMAERYDVQPGLKKVRMLRLNKYIIWNYFNQSYNFANILVF